MTSQDISKYFVGPHEVQECHPGEGEVDLPTYNNMCTKNPGHKGFIPYKDFSLNHFPPDYQDKDLELLTRSLSELTVRIAVTYTSEYRPEFLKDSVDLYPGYNMRGVNSLRTGTGRVCYVTKYTVDQDGECPCPECNSTKLKPAVWWKVSVMTAVHVVYDDSEAMQSSCRLWFDEENSPVVKLQGWKVVGASDIRRDCCELSCITHDVDLARKLETSVKQFNTYADVINKKYISSRNVNKLTVIISHPHGCPKQVSVGYWVDKQRMGCLLTRYTYTTCTCPGSSGAMIYTLGCDIASTHVHSGANSFGSNYSGVWQDLNY